MSGASIMPKAWGEGGTANPPVIPLRLTGTLVAFLVIGTLAFSVGLQLDPTRAWQIYLVNFLFWTGLAQAGVVFAAVYRVVGAKWGPPIRRLAEGMVAFLPVSLVLLAVLFFGLGVFFGPVRALNPERGAWFDPRFIFVRSSFGLAAITVLSVLFVYYSLRPEIGVALGQGLKPTRWLYRSLTEGWQGNEVETQRCARSMDILAPGLIAAYPLVYSFMAFELIMALDPFWYSSLFGGYFFVSTFYLGLAGVTVVTVLARRYLNIEAITSSQFADLGKLLLGFSLTYMAMVWSQYIVIWYGNLPEETHFLVRRIWTLPWAPLSWAVLVTTFAAPLLVFLSRRAKEIPQVMLWMGVLIAAGLWLERFVLVVPSLWLRPGIPFAWLELGVTAGFLGAVGLSYLFFLRTFPVCILAGEAILPVENNAGESTVATRPARA